VASCYGLWPRALPLLFACFSLVGAFSVACEPAESPAGSQARQRAAEEDRREPTLDVPQHKATYDRGVTGLAAMDQLRGSPMSPSFANDLGFKCAGLRDVAKALAGERDPLVVRLVSRIDKTCSYDVPLASALFELREIEARRRDDPGADVKKECVGLKLAIGDFGSAYLENPRVVDIIGKDLSFCGASDDTVRVVRPGR
jgi:hypothetical protein